MELLESMGSDFLMPIMILLRCNYVIIKIFIFKKTKVKVNILLQVVFASGWWIEKYSMFYGTGGLDKFKSNDINYLDLEVWLEVVM